MELKQSKRQEHIKRLHKTYYTLLMSLIAIGGLCVMVPYSVIATQRFILNQYLDLSNVSAADILMFVGLVLVFSSLIALNLLPWPSTKKQLASYALWWGAFLSIVTGAFACMSTLNGKPFLAIAGWFLTSILVIFNVLMIKTSI